MKCDPNEETQWGRDWSTSRGDNYLKSPYPPQCWCPCLALLPNSHCFHLRSSPRPGIPTLILLDTEGHMITRQGRVEVLNDPECRLFPWHPRPVLELSESNAVQLHEGPCLVLFVGESSCLAAPCGAQPGVPRLEQHSLEAY